MKPPKKPINKRLAAAVERGAARKGAANDAQPTTQVNRENIPPVQPSPSVGGGGGGPPADSAIAPLWDLPDNNPPVRIPLNALDATLVFRYVHNDETGKLERAHCGNVAPDATGSTIKRQWGGGRYFLQARIANRVVAARELLIDGPSPGNLPFGPIGELPSGLVTLQQDPQVAGYFALFQMWMAQTRTDFQLILQMQQETLKLLGSQFGASMVNTHLKEQLAAAISRTTTLEKLLDDGREREREYEREKIKRKYKGDGTDWVEVVEAVGEIAPTVLQALPPKLKGFLEGLVVDAGKQLPSGVTEHPSGG